MLRAISLPVLLLVSCGLICEAYARDPEIIDPATAQKDPDFKIQGEYRGEGEWPESGLVKVGAQAIALGRGQFTVVVTRGGLPGDGWRRGEPQFSLSGKRNGEVTMLSGTNCSGQIAGDVMTIAGSDGRTKLELKRVVRHSPTEGAKPVEGAVVLFDGTTAENFLPGTLLPDGNLLSEETSKRRFGDYTLHVEFRLSYMPEARGQARSNSGVYLHGSWEVQVLDSFGLAGANNECGALYGLRQPDVNMCFPPLAWQTYDVEFSAPKFRDGKKVASARVTVWHNGVVVQPDIELSRVGPGYQPDGPEPRPIYLQGHGNKVEYRNIWVKEK